MIYGETGTGKELIARAIHNLSPRRPQAFVKLNCAAIPTGLVESELFGHERGAFTGAIAQRIGRFELANHGTVFLDEIGDLPLELQPKLLRVLQEREFERLGNSRTLRSDARLIAATNGDLAAMVEAQRFRADLFYRLNVFPIHVPPLRERVEDIPLLVRHFVQHFARRMNRTIDTISSDTMESLVRYQWPGNIRELENVMERAVILSSGPVLRVPLEDLSASRRPRPGKWDAPDAGGGRTGAHPGDGEGDEVGALGTAGGGDAAGDEPVDAAVSNEEARDRAAGVSAAARTPVPIGWHLVVPRHRPIGTGHSMGAAAGQLASRLSSLKPRGSGHAWHSDCLRMWSGMLKITVQHSPREVRLKLEGNLTGAWVTELEDCWRSAHSSLAGRSLCVDLMAVEQVDRAGRYLLALMRRNGAQLVASGAVMTELVRTISGDWPLTEE